MLKCLENMVNVNIKLDLYIFNKLNILYALMPINKNLKIK